MAPDADHGPDRLPDPDPESEIPDAVDAALAALDEAAGGTPPSLPDREACAQIAAKWGDLLPEGELPDVARRAFAAAVDSLVAPIRRFQSRTWLVSNGFLIAPPVVEPPTTPDAPADAPPAPTTSPDEPPAHPELEMAVIGRLILSPELIAVARETLSGHDFSSAERSRLFRKICVLDERNEAVTPLVIEAEYASSGRASMLGRDLIHNALRVAAPADALPRYYEFLRQYAARRANVLAARQLLQDVAAGGSTRDSLEKARAILDRVDDQADRDESRHVRAGLKWPDPIDEAAYHGVAGDFVRLIAPRTESDPVAILAQLLVCFGNAIGRRPHWSVDASRHYCNEFLVVCGLTSRGRKGTSWDVTRMLFERSCPDWVSTCFHSGVASGEGLIRTVRDAVYSKQKVGNEMVSILEDAGSDDKRALWIEDEFQGVLAVMRREGSTLSANLRKAWQSGSLENANKNSPARATGAHVSMVAHITFDELKRSLGMGEIGNGFANRFLWICSRRSRLLPRGGGLFRADFQPLLDPIVERVTEAIEYVNAEELFESIEVGMTEAAWAIYEPLYAHLSRPQIKAIGQVTDRAEAHVRRLAVIYAILDRKHVVDVDHLKAALAFWDYCDRSVKFIFGDEEADPMAEEILAALTAAGPEGLSHRHVTQKLFRGRKFEEVSKALEALVSASIIRQEERKTTGRPAKFWVIWS